MKGILSSKLFWFFAITVVVGGLAVGQFLATSQDVEYVTEEVVRGDVIQTVSATGQVKAASDIRLNFKIIGRLNSINYDVGDIVEAGDVLATLRSTDLQINVSRARANLQEAQANLQKIVAGATAEEIAIAQAELDKALANLASAQSDLETNNLVYGQALENAKADLLTDIKSALSKVEISLQEVNDTLIYEGDANNFTTSNLALQQLVEDGYDSSITKLAMANSAYELAVVNGTDQNLSLAFDRASSVLLSTQTTLSNLRSLLNYVLTNAVLSQSDLTTLKSIINTELTTTNASISTVQGSNQDLFNAQINFDTKVTQAENAIFSAEKSVATARANLALKTASARSEDIALAQAQVTKAEADLEAALNDLSETSITAPQAGVITAVNYEIGEQTTLATPVIEMSATNGFKIEVDIPESDIAKVEVGDIVDVTLDAFDDEDLFHAEVVSIDPSETEIQDVIYFRVTAVFSEDQSADVAGLVDRIKPGMTANIEIKTAEAKNVLLVPFRAVREVDNQRYVEVLENGQAVRRNVSIGLRGEEGDVEIISGLEEGELVITSTR